MSVTEVPSHAELMALAKSVALLGTDRLTDRSFSPGFLLDIIDGFTAAIAEEAIRRGVLLQEAWFFGSAGGEDLDKRAADAYQLVRQGGSSAIGTARFSRPTAGAGPVLIDALTAVETPDGLQFLTTQSVLLTGLTIDADVAAVITGESGIVPAASITVISSTLLDPTITVANPEPTAGGTSTESDALFRHRIRNYVRNLRRGTPGALIFGALTVPGVAQASVQQLDQIPDSFVGVLASTTVDAETTSVFADRGAPIGDQDDDLRVLITYQASAMANNETLLADLRIQDANDAAGTDVADFGTAITNAAVRTAPSSGGPHVLTGVYQALFEVTAAKQFLRSKQNLKTSASGTVSYAVTFQFLGRNSEVQLYVSDITGASNEALIDAVAAEIENWRSAGVQVAVIGAVVVDVDIELTLTFRDGFDTQVTRNAIVQAVVNEVNTLDIGQTLRQAKIIGAADAAVPGALENLGVADPVADLPVAANSLIRTSEARITLTVG